MSNNTVPFHRVLFGASFLMSLSYGMANYALIFYVKDVFQADKAGVGLISSLMSLTYFLGILGFVRWKIAHPRWVLWLSAWTMAVCVGAYLLVPLWGVTLFFHGLFGLAMALFWPRMMGWLSWGHEGPALSRVMGRFNLSWSTGGILAPLVGGALIEINVHWPFYLIVFCLGVTGALMPLGSRWFAAMRQPQTETAAQTLTEFDPEPTPLRYGARLAMVGFYVVSGCLLFIFPVHAKESLGFSETLIGAFLFTRLGVASLGFWLWGRWKFWHFRPRSLLLSQVALVANLLLFPWGRTAVDFFLLFGINGLVFSFQYSYALFHGASGSRNRERSMTIHEAAINLGLFLGTLLVGWVSQVWSMATAFGVCAATSLVVLVLQTGLNAALWTKDREPERSSTRP